MKFQSLKFPLHEVAGLTSEEHHGPKERIQKILFYINWVTKVHDDLLGLLLMTENASNVPSS